MAIVRDAAWMRANLDHEFKDQCGKLFLDSELNLYKGDGFVSIDDSVDGVCAWRTKDGRRWLRFETGVSVVMTDVDDCVWRGKTRGLQRQDARILIQKFENKDLTKETLEKHFEIFN